MRERSRKHQRPSLPACEHNGFSSTSESLCGFTKRMSYTSPGPDPGAREPKTEFIQRYPNDCLFFSAFHSMRTLTMTPKHAAGCRVSTPFIRMVMKSHRWNTQKHAAMGGLCASHTWSSIPYGNTSSYSAGNGRLPLSMRHAQLRTLDMWLGTPRRAYCRPTRRHKRA